MSTTSRIPASEIQPGDIVTTTTVGAGTISRLVENVSRRVLATGTEAVVVEWFGAVPGLRGAESFLAPSDRYAVRR